MEEDRDTTSDSGSSQEEKEGKLNGIAASLAEINTLLDNFESSGENHFIKDAATKIKSTTPILKHISGLQEYKDDDQLYPLLTKCKKEMKLAFERTKKVAENDK
jgi:hypothetical protein